MKAQIEKNQFFHLLSPAQSLIEKRNVIPILSKILLKIQNGELSTYVTDQESSLQSTAKIKDAKSGQACVDARSLFEIIKELPEGPLFLEKSDKKESLRVRTKNSVFNLAGVSPEDFPVFPQMENPQFFSLKTSTLADLIEQTSYCVSMDETRYHLNGVYCEKKNSQLRFVATDGHRLSYADLNQAGEFSVPEGTIIPRKGLQEILKILSLGESEEVFAAIHPPRLLIRYENFLLSTRLIEGKYPNYKQLIPKASKIKVSVGKEELTKALKRVSILSSLQSKSVHFSWEKKKVTLTAHHPELGDAKEDVPLNKTNGELEIRFNARYVLDSLSHLPGEEVFWEMNASAEPGLIKTDKSSGAAIIMPMKL